MARWRRHCAVLNQHPRRCRGAAMIEFHVVALLAMLPLCLGTLQAALLMVENHHLDHAAFLAARHGAVRHGDLSEVRSAFAQASSTLFVSSYAPLDRGNIVARVAAAHAAATADIALHATVRVLTPDANARADFAIRRDDATLIPNDALEFRSTAPGRRSGISLQQANVLRVEFVYCRPLIVPFAGPMLLGTLRILDLAPALLRGRAGASALRGGGPDAVGLQSDFVILAFFCRPSTQALIFCPSTACCICSFTCSNGGGTESRMSVTRIT
jgi:hypothetical protein